MKMCKFKPLQKPVQIGRHRYIQANQHEDRLSKYQQMIDLRESIESNQSQPQNQHKVHNDFTDIPKLILLD